MLIYFVVSCIVVIVSLCIAVSKINGYIFTIAKYLESQIERVSIDNRKNIQYLKEDLEEKLKENLSLKEDVLYMKDIQEEILRSVLLTQRLNKELWIDRENNGRLLYAIDYKVAELLGGQKMVYATIQGKLKNVVHSVMVQHSLVSSWRG